MPRSVSTLRWMACRNTSLTRRASSGMLCALTVRMSFAAQEILTLLRCAPFSQCGQNGGNGGKDPTNFTCTCESESPYCKNCFRWWMSTTMQSLMSLNEALPGHTSFDLTMQQLDGMRKHSPYTSRALPSWAYIDDYLWYVLMWMHSYQWHGETGDLQDAANTMELSACARRSHQSWPYDVNTDSPLTYLLRSTPSRNSGAMGYGLHLRRNHVDVSRRGSTQELDHHS